MISLFLLELLLFYVSGGVFLPFISFPSMKVADFVSMDFEEENKAEEASPAGEEKSWEDIIPETERKSLEAEEEQQKQLELYLPKRPRKSVKKVNAL